MEKVALFGLKVSRSKAKSTLKQIYKTHEKDADSSPKLDAAILSSLSNALLDDMDKLDAKLDALCKAPMKTAQQYLTTALNALFSGDGGSATKRKLFDDYFNLAYQQAQQGFHSVQEAGDKIICGRVAMMSAIFAFRGNLALLLKEVRLRFSRHCRRLQCAGGAQVVSRDQRGVGPPQLDEEALDFEQQDGRVQAHRL